MLDDIIYLTKTIFKKSIRDNMAQEIAVPLYEVHRHLQELINMYDLVANHYLALSLEEEFLQNSSFGSPMRKWQFVLNRDLEALNNNVKKLILSLNKLGHRDYSERFISYLHKYYDPKGLYGFIREEYYVGEIVIISEECFLVSNTLKIPDKGCFEDFKLITHINLSTHEQRLKLQSEILHQKDLIIQQRNQIRKYIIRKFTIEDLL